VYIAEPSQTVNGGGPGGRTAVPAGRAIRGRPTPSVGVIKRFLLPVLVNAAAQSPAIDRHTIGPDDQVVAKRSNPPSHLRIATQSCQMI
jgi:hypothetical protein